MSTSTKEHAAQNVAGNHDTTDSQGPVSAPVSLEDVERAAALLRPSWEAEPFDDFDVAALASGTTQGVSDEPTKRADMLAQAPPPEARSPEPAPVDTPPPSQPRKLELVDASSDNDEQGPVGIVAAIPKRTDVQIKDEPSVVLAGEEEQERNRPTVPPPPRPRASRPSPVAPAADDVALPGDQKSHNRRIVVGVLAVAGLLVLAATVRFAVGGGEDKPAGSGSGVPTSAKDTSTATAANTAAANTAAANTAVPTATLATATATTETAAPTQTSVPTTRTSPVATKAEPAATRPSPDTPASAHTESPPNLATATAKPPPATTAAKPPPAPTRTESPPKPPAGGIVRETPF